MTTELWLPVPDFPSYEISSWGRIRRGDRLLTPRRTGRYLQINLRREGKRTPRRIHRLVLEAFEGPRPEGAVTRHLDGDSLNNERTNLAYGTYQENSDDAARHGTQGPRPTCRRGHARTPADTMIQKNGMQRCRVCRREYEKERYRTKNVRTT